MVTHIDTQRSASIRLDEFQRYARKGAAVAIVEHQRTMKLIAVGTTPDGRSVAWLEPGIDTVQHFVSALGQAFGPELARLTAQELDLTPRPGLALASALVHRAIDMTETARVALDGVDFLSNLADNGPPALPWSKPRSH